MAERKIGTVVTWRDLSSVLAIFRMVSQEGSRFPEYKAGQYIALRRDDCKLTKKIGVLEGRPVFGPDLDEQGNQKIGSVTHSYSISSAPFETQQNGYLEFYVILEKDNEGASGRLTESIFHIRPAVDDKITYVDRITGDFTLDKRTSGCRNVLFVGTGTGMAPFAGMIKQLHQDAMNGKSDGVRYTLLHTNRTYEELGYHQDLLTIERSGVLDFVYLPSVSRPTSRDLEDPRLGKGRANNVLRILFGMPLKEEEAVQNASGEEASALRRALERTARPVLPEHLPASEVRKRLEPHDRTVILTCGNPLSMADIKYVADSNQIRYEKEDW